MKVAKGLTAEQQALFVSHYCPRGHRFDGYNYPLPDGDCALCTDAELQLQINDMYEAAAMRGIPLEPPPRESLPLALTITLGESGVPVPLLTPSPQRAAPSPTKRRKRRTSHSHRGRR